MSDHYFQMKFVACSLHYSSTTIGAGIVKSPKHDSHYQNSQGMGTGPYVLSSNTFTIN